MALEGRSGLLLLRKCPKPPVEALLKAAAGSVWEAVLSSEDFEEIRGRWKISSAVRRPDGIHVRIVHPAKPMGDAATAEPTMEDAYLNALNFQPKARGDVGG